MFSNPFLTAYSASYFIIGIAGLFWSAFVFLSPPRDSIKQAFSRYLFVVVWWAFFSIPMINASNIFWGTLWDRICFMGAIFIPVSFLHFNFSFLGIEEKYKNFLRLNYLIGLSFLAFIFSSYLIPSASLKFGLTYFTDPGPLYIAFIAYFFAVSALCIFNFFLAFIKAKGNRKRQLFNIFWSSILGYSLGGLNYNLAFEIPPPTLAIIGNFGIFFHISVYAYTITKQRLMDVSVIISRALAELLATTSLAILYLSAVWPYRFFISTKIDLPFITGSILYGIFVAHAHRRLRILFQTTADKLFLRGKYDYYKSLSEASSHVGQKLSLPHILGILYSTFHDVVEIANPRVFLPENFTESDKRSNKYLIYDENTLRPNQQGQEIKFDSPLINKLIAQRGPLSSIKDIDAALVVPCLVENRLVGLFALGPKLSEDPYTDEDIRLLEVLANQAAITLDHTRSYEKISADLEAAGKQLERSQRLAAIGTLTAGVTHEIRNPLTVIRAETERLTKQARDKNYLENYRDLLLKHITRIEGIVHRMLGLAKERENKERTKGKTEVNLKEQMEAVLSFIKWDGVHLKKDLQYIPPIIGNAEELEQVFVNLVQNAMEAMPGGGELGVKTYPANGRPVVEIRDTGKGIPAEIKEKIFDPFFSTRHEGTGLGLSIAYRIIREHGGDIKVQSEVGKGTIFKILF